MALQHSIRSICQKLPFILPAVAGSSAEGFPMLALAHRWRSGATWPALEILARWKPRGSWRNLWGKCADGWGDGFIRGSAEGAHDG